MVSKNENLKLHRNATVSIALKEYEMENWETQSGCSQGVPQQCKLAVVGRRQLQYIDPTLIVEQKYDLFTTGKYKLSLAKKYLCTT